MSWRRHFDTPEHRDLVAQGRRNAAAAIAAGEKASPYTRQQVRALKKQLAKLEAAEVAKLERREAKLESKARRAGLR